MTGNGTLKEKNVPELSGDLFKDAKGCFGRWDTPCHQGKPDLTYLGIRGIQIILYRSCAKIHTYIHTYERNRLANVRTFQEPSPPLQYKYERNYYITINKCLPWSPGCQVESSVYTFTAFLIKPAKLEITL